VSPEEFIPLSEDNGLIVPIGLGLLYQACKVLKGWHRGRINHLTMAVNISYRQINKDDLVNDLKLALLKYDLPEALLYFNSLNVYLLTISI